MLKADLADGKGHFLGVLGGDELERDELAEALLWGEGHPHSSRVV